MEDDPLARVEHLERQVARLEAELGELRTRVDRRETAGAGAADATSADGWSPPVPVVEPATWPSPAPAPEPATRPNLAIDSETLLKWSGVALVVLAVGFAVSTAISRNWIGPELQLLGALIVGFGLIGAGLRLRESRPGWTHALCSGGVLALFTTVASDLFVDQANTGIAFAATVAIGAGGVVLARSIRSEWVAVSTLAGGMIGWAVISRDDPPVPATVAWVVLLIAVLVAVATECEWHALRFLSHLTGMIVVLALLEEAAGTADRVAIIVATALISGSMCVVPGIGKLTSVWQQLEVQLAALTAPWALAISVALLDTERDLTIGWTAVSIAAGAAAIAVAMRGRLRPAHFISLLIGASITLSIGLAVLLSTTAAFVALAVQGAGLVVLSRALGRNLRVLINAGLLITIATVDVTVAMIDAWTDGATVADDVGHALIVVAVAFAAWQSRELVVRRLGALLTLALTLVWLGSVLVHLPQGQAIVSISWAIIGTAVFVTGAVRQDAQVGMTGLAVLGLTVGKLLTVDLREVDALWRAGLFFLVGIGLLRLGFMLPRLGNDDGDDTRRRADRRRRAGRAPLTGARHCRDDRARRLAVPRFRPGCDRRRAHCAHVLPRGSACCLRAEVCRSRRGADGTPVGRAVHDVAARAGAAPGRRRDRMVPQRHGRAGRPPPLHRPRRPGRRLPRSRAGSGDGRRGVGRVAP